VPAAAYPAAPSAAEPPLISGGAALGAAVGAAVVSAIGVLLVVAPTHFADWYWPWATVSAFWLATILLPRTRTVWAFLGVVGWNLLLYVGLELLFSILFRRFLTLRLAEYLHHQFPYQTITSNSAEFTSIQMNLLVQALVGLLILVVIASLLGATFAVLAARWSRARGLPLERGFAYSMGVPLLVTGGIVVFYVSILVALLALPANKSGGAALAGVWGILIALLASVAIPWYASWRALRTLRRAASLPEAQAPR
jgi:hypothetical protein